ncbi:MAG: hypothetical protein WA655_09540 [Candidatus Korobacteraceae bacterium]
MVPPLGKQVECDLQPCTIAAAAIPLHGTVYKLTNANGTWTYSSLHDFNYSGGDGSTPYGSVVLDAAGNVHGTTDSGPEPVGHGIAFEIAP